MILADRMPVRPARAPFESVESEGLTVRHPHVCRASRTSGVPPVPNLQTRRPALPRRRPSRTAVTIMNCSAVAAPPSRDFAEALIPWLLSHGHGVTAIDNDITAARRRRIMGDDFYKLKVFLEKKNQSVDGLRLRTADFADPLGDSGLPEHFVRQPCRVTSATTRCSCSERRCSRNTPRWQASFLRDSPSCSLMRCRILLRARRK